MANDESKRLVVDVMARVDKLEKGLARAGQTLNQQTGQMEARSKQFANKFEKNITSATDRIGQSFNKVGGLGKAFVGGLAAGVAIGALEGIRRAAEDSTRAVLEMSDQAKMAGVSFKAFQQLKFAAEQNRIGVDALTDGLKELNLRADEFIQTGAGSASEAFQRLGYNAEDLSKKLKEPDQLFLEIIGRLEQFDKASQIRIADEVFGGTGGEKFVQLISQGEAGLRRQIQAAQDLGIVMDDSMIKKAEEVNQKFNLIATTIGTHVKSAIVNAVDAWSTFLDSYRDFASQQKGTLQFRQAQLGLEKVDLENTILQTPKSEEMVIRKLQSRLAALEAEDRQITDEISRRNVDKPASTPAWTPPTAPPGGFGSTSSGKTDLTQYLAGGKDARHITGMSSSFEGKLEKLFAALPKEMAGQLKINSGFRDTARQAELWQQALAKYGSVSEARKWVAPPGNSQHNKGNAADLGYGSDAAREWTHANASKFGLSFPLSNENWHIEDADARAGAMADKTKDLEARGQSYDAILAKAREMISSENLEAQAIGMTEQAAARLRYEQELLNEAKRAGIELNPQQTTALKQLAADMASAEAETRRLTLSQDAAKQAAADFSEAAGGIAKGFVSDLMRGTSAADALRNALARIGDMALDGLFNQIFGGGQVKDGGIFGSLIGQIFGGIGKRENGGPVSAGTPYIVGEKRAEVFVPNTSGQIVPRIGAPVAPSLAKGGGMQTVRNESALTVNIQGANGDEHVKALVNQGVSQALQQQQKSMERGGFGSMQTAFVARKG